jgi:DNA-binding NtrC family response regulator
MKISNLQYKKNGSGKTYTTGYSEFEIVLPSLHECPDDILSLAHHFRKKFSGELKRPTEGFSSEAEQLLLSYRWPGNVRNCITG